MGGHERERHEEREGGQKVIGTVRGCVTMGTRVDLPVRVHARDTAKWRGRV